MHGIIVTGVACLGCHSVTLYRSEPRKWGSVFDSPRIAKKKFWNRFQLPETVLAMQDPLPIHKNISISICVYRKDLRFFYLFSLKDWNAFLAAVNTSKRNTDTYYSQIIFDGYGHYFFAINWINRKIG